MLWRGKWQSTPVFLPGKSRGQWSLVSYSPWSMHPCKIPQTVTRKLSILDQKNISYFIVSVGQGSRSGQAGGFLLRESHEATVKIFSEAAVISSVNWDCRIHFLAHFRACLRRSASKLTYVVAGRPQVLAIWVSV